MSKVAVIGPSGAGKSSLSRLLPGLVADMDQDLGTDPAPLLSHMLDWMTASEFEIVPVSVHTVPLKEMADLKRSDTDSRFAGLWFIYLFCQKADLERRLRDQPPSERNQGTILETLRDFDKMDYIFRKLSNEVLDTTFMSPREVADAVRRKAVNSQSMRRPGA